MKRGEASVVINRPIDEVFEFVVNPENNSEWWSGILESEQTSEGPMSVGATTREVQKFLGRRMEATSEVIEYEPNSKIGLKGSSGPMQAKNWKTFESVPGGTRLTMVAEVDIGGFFKLAEGLAMRVYQGDTQRAFATLKEILEGQAEGSA